MEENRRNPSAGMEVPVAGGGNVVQWIEISVPSPSVSSSSIGANSSEDNECVQLPLSEDYASSSVIGEPSISFVWRINKTSPNALELLQLSAKSGFPITGLRFVFAQTLSPFAFVYADEVQFHCLLHFLDLLVLFVCVELESYEIECVRVVIVVVLSTFFTLSRRLVLSTFLNSRIR